MLYNLLMEPDKEFPRRRQELLRPDKLKSPVYVPKPWERQLRETSWAFSMFKHYLSLPESGKRRTVAEAERSSGRTAGSLKKLSRLNNWEARARAWDAECERIISRAKLSEIEEMARRHARIGQAMTDLGGQRIDTLVEELDAISPSDAIKMVKEGIAVERRAAGLDGGGGTGERQITIKIVEESPTASEDGIIEGDFEVLD